MQAFIGYLKAYRPFLYIAISTLIFKVFILYTRMNAFDFETYDSTAYLDLARNFPEPYLYPSELLLSESLLRTPGYPLFIYLLGNSKTNLILIQFFLHITIAIVSVGIYSHLSNRATRRAKILVFALVNIESSLFVYSFYVLTEVLFSLLTLIAVTFLLGSKKSQPIFRYIMIVVTIFVALMVRPIGIILLIFLSVAAIISKNKAYLVAIGTTLFIYFGWSAFNLYRADIFTFSTIQNYNLLMYEGAGAKAQGTNLELTSVQRSEVLRQEKLLGHNQNIEKIDSYSFSRGLELISEYPLSFLAMHIEGIGAILFGPNQGELTRLISSGDRIKANSNLERICVVVSSILTLIVSSLFLLGLMFKKNRNVVFLILNSYVVTFLVFSSGAQAYGRFRAPIAAFLVVLAVYALEELKPFLGRILRKRTERQNDC